MEIDHKCWASAPEWLDDVQLATLTETDFTLWAEARDRGDGPPWTECDGVPRYRRMAVEAWLIACSIRGNDQRGRL